MTKFLISMCVIFLAANFNEYCVSGDEATTVASAKELLSTRLNALSLNTTVAIELSNRDLDDILQAFSGLGFAFEELDFEFLRLSEELEKTVVVRDSSSVFNKYKENTGKKYPKFDSMEYNGKDGQILLRFTPNSEDGQYYVETIDEREVHYKKELLLSVSKINETKISVKSGIFSTDNVHINSGISFKYRNGDEKVDTESILGFLPRTQIVFVIEGNIEGEKIAQGSLLPVLSSKYGKLNTKGDYIK